MNRLFQSRRSFLTNSALLAGLSPLGVGSIASLIYALQGSTKSIFRDTSSRTKITQELAESLRLEEESIAAAIFWGFSKYSAAELRLDVNHKFDLIEISGRKPLPALANILPLLEFERDVSPTQPFLIAGQDISKHDLDAVNYIFGKSKLRTDLVQIENQDLPLVITLDASIPQHFEKAQAIAKWVGSKYNRKIEVRPLPHVEFWSDWTKFPLSIVEWRSHRSALANLILTQSPKSPFRLLPLDQTQEYGFSKSLPSRLFRLA